MIDVGTHKAEEVRLFEGRPSFSLLNHARLIRLGLTETRSIRRISRSFKARHNCRYVLVEPVMHRELLAFVASVSSAILIGGVSSCTSDGPITLFMAPDSLGNSIVPSKPGLTGRTRETFNVDFARLYEFLLTTFVTTGDCDKIILRINAEGVEGPIIDFLANSASVKPDVMAGSIGDIKKCFGQEAYDTAMEILETSGIPFVYFTSSARTWSHGLTEIMAVLA